MSVAMERTRYHRDRGEGRSGSAVGAGGIGAPSRSPVRVGSAAAQQYTAGSAANHGGPAGTSRVAGDPVRARPATRAIRERQDHPQLRVIHGGMAHSSRPVSCRAHPAPHPLRGLLLLGVATALAVVVLGLLGALAGRSVGASSLTADLGMSAPVVASAPAVQPSSARDWSAVLAR